MKNKKLPVTEENQHVSELIEQLNKGKKSKEAKVIADVFGCICGMEHDLKTAIAELNTLRSELSIMREEQKHPIKTMLHRAADSLMSKIKSAYKQILSLKDKFINECKQAVDDIKDKGIVTANNIAGVLDIRGDLEISKTRINELITYNEKKIANIDIAAAEYHTAGRAIKNIGRSLVGKELITDIKPNGKLAKLLQSPFRLEIKNLKRSLVRTDKALERLGKLEKAAEISAERGRASVIDEMQHHKKAVRTNPAITAPKRLRAVNPEH